MTPRHRPSSTVGRNVPPDAKALDEMARRAWRERGIVILWPERIRDDWDRQHVLNLANSLYGPRHGASGGR